MTRTVFIACCLLPLALCGPAYSQLDDLRMPVTIDAERTDYDGRTSMLEFTGLRLTQGDISIEADIARASRMDFDDSVWQFDGEVVFDLAEGRITCDSASLEFRDFTLMRARIEGSPATFRFRRAGSQEPAYAEAARLDYDVPAGLVEFSGGATINEGGNRIASEMLVYNIAEQRINAVSGGDGEGRVKVIYLPPEDGDAAGTEPPSPPAEDELAADETPAPDARDEAPEPVDAGEPAPADETAADDATEDDGSGGE